MNLSASSPTTAPHPGDRSDLIDVAVALPINATFTYRVPPELEAAMAPGMRVLVPFGRRRVTGYVLGRTERAPEAGLKNVAALLDDHPLFPEGMLPLFQWVSD